jgi:hypothetical protein
LLANPDTLMLNGTVVVPGPASFCAVATLPLIELFVLYWNQTVVSGPLGFTSPFNVAAPPAMLVAPEVVTLGPMLAACVKLM